MTEDTSFRGWAIVELMGHRQTAGQVSEVTIAGTILLRVDTPASEGEAILATQYYGGSAIYCLTPTDEGTVRRLLASQPYNLPPAVRLALPAPADTPRWED